MKTLGFWLLMVIILSLLPMGGPMTEARHAAELVFHFIVYAITAMLIMSVLVNDSGPAIKSVLIYLGGRNSAWVAAGLAAAFGLLLEGAREAYPASGGFSAESAAVNAIGAASWAAYAIWSSSRKKRRKPL